MPEPTTSLYDANGNVTEVLKKNPGNSAGSLAARYEYDPFGNTIRSTGTYADANPFRFSTKYFDTETTLYYYGFRYYDPTTGRWLSRDPIGEVGGFNLFAMVQNDPINWNDYLGMCPKSENAQNLANDIKNGNPNPIIDEAVKAGEDAWKSTQDSLEKGVELEYCNSICEACDGSRVTTLTVPGRRLSCKPLDCPDAYPTLVSVQHTHPNGAPPSSKNDEGKLAETGKGTPKGQSDGSYATNNDVPVFCTQGPGKHSAIISPGTKNDIYPIQ